MISVTVRRLVLKRALLRQGGEIQSVETIRVGRTAAAAAIADTAAAAGITGFVLLGERAVGGGVFRRERQ